MQNFISTFSPSKSFQFVNEQLSREQESPHRRDCHGPPQAARVRRHDDRSPPRRLAAAARSDPWKTPPAQVGFRGDATWRRRSPWVVGSGLWNNSRGGDYLPGDRCGKDCHPEQEICALAALGTPKIEFEAFAFPCWLKDYFGKHGALYAGLIEFIVSWHASMTYSGMSKGSAILCVKSQFSAPGHDPGKDVRMPKTIAVVQLPEILRNGSSHLVKLAGKVDSFSLLLGETPGGELKRSIEVQFHSMVFATRKEIRKCCPPYHYLPGEGILDFSTDCASAQLEPGDLGQAPPPERAGSARRAASSQVFQKSKFLKRR